MKRTSSYAAIVIAACCAVFAACETSPTGPTLIGGLYAYTAYNAGDSAVVTGTIVLRNTDSTALTGTWDLRIIRNASQTGPQSGLGTLAGSTAGCGERAGA
ncbi:MAG TPA: hypothetical protein VI932_11425 [Bacteroidota bacterium]|nr:hypothetical protein [Bacteroidota bacterium]